MPLDTADHIAQRLDEPTAQGIAQAIGALVSAGVLTPGDKLPTVRSLATRVGVSSSTVADAWRMLATHGVIDTDRRRGTTVRAARAELEGRWWQVAVTPGTIQMDLSTGIPDHGLLPALGPVLERIHPEAAVTSYLDEAILPALRDALVDRWPFVPAGLTVVDGALDAIDRLVDAVVTLGDAVVVEDPTFPPILDILDRAGARVVGAAIGPAGPDLDRLAAAMESDPVALIVQPRAHNPTGACWTEATAAAIAGLVAGTRTLVIEDDHSGDVAGAPLYSVGRHLPHQTVHVHSFSKSHGPDLRIAAIGGAAAPVEAVVRRRQLGPAWTSRLTQRILVAMLDDDGVVATVADAAAEYQRRRGQLRSALATHGIDVIDGSGLNMWVPVDDEQRAVVALAAHSVGVAPGRPFRVGDDGTHHLRVSLGEARGDLDDLAATIAAVAHPGPRAV